MKKIQVLVLIFKILTFYAHANNDVIDNLTIPYKFKSGDTISASQVNNNFLELEDKYNQLLNKINDFRLIPKDLLVYYTANEALNYSEIRERGSDVCFNSIPKMIHAQCTLSVPMLFDSNKSINNSNFTSFYSIPEENKIILSNGLVLADNMSSFLNQKWYSNLKSSPEYLNLLQTYSSSGSVNYIAINSEQKVFYFEFLENACNTINYSSDEFSNKNSGGCYDHIKKPFTCLCW